jgi:hypothetical protein
MSGRMKVRYWRAPTRLRYAVGSSTAGPASAEILAQVSTRVEQGLQLCMPRVYCRWERNSVLVSLNCYTKKMMERSKIFHGKFLLQG